MTRLVWRDEQRLLNLSEVVSYSEGSGRPAAESLWAKLESESRV